MLSGITPPPAPPAGFLMGAGAAAVVLGVVLLLLGRRLSRAVMALTFAGVAGLCAYLLLSGLSNTNTVIAVAAAALLAGAAGFVFSRFAWTLLLGVMLGSAALIAFGAVYAGGLEAPPAWPEGGEADFAAWTTALGQYAWDWTTALWQYNALAVGLSALAPLCIGLAVGAFYPRAMLILVTGLIGAVLTVGGAGVVVWGVRPEAAGAWIERIHVPGVVAGALLLVALAIQTWKLIAENKGKSSPAAGKDAEAKSGK